jgi:RNA polymerase sigma-70 factor (ECF subfamily)
MSLVIIQGLEERLQAERSRLVGLCATLTGNVDVAEDLAQETLLEAWRSIDKLRETELFTHWLSGIARNICLRWLRKNARNVMTPLPTMAEEQLADDFDLEIDLERKELAELLDRALTALPAETREVLVARYIEESSLAELTKRFGLQTSALAMRLQRGKLALKRVLQEGGTLDAYEMPGRDEFYSETNVWCTECGEHRLQGRFLPEQGKLSLTCPQCGEYTNTSLDNTSEAQLFRGIKKVKPAMNRLAGWINRYYGIHLDEHYGPCLRCGELLPLRIVNSLKEARFQVGEPGDGNWRDGQGAYQYCTRCRSENWTSLKGMILSLPEGLRFLREHPRVRTLPEQEIEVDGMAAVVERFESVNSQQRYEVVAARENYRILLIDGRRP